MLFSNSRYQQSGTYQVTGPNGTAVTVVSPPAPAPAVVQGYFRRRQDAPRLDLVANFFLRDATAFWRLCDANGAIVPDALAARDLIGIPPTGT